MRLGSDWRNSIPLIPELRSLFLHEPRMMEWVRNPIARRWRYPRIKAEMSGACALEDGGAGCLLMANRIPARAQLDIATGNP
jgi:hypothetical protein